MQTGMLMAIKMVEAGPGEAYRELGSRARRESGLTVTGLLSFSAGLVFDLTFLYIYFIIKSKKEIFIFLLLYNCIY